MINGLYSGAAALDVLAKQQERISANLMHLNTSGHRRLQSGVKQRFDINNSAVSRDLGPEVDRIQTDFSAGRNAETQRPLDVALSGDGFFVFDDGNREVLSRNGRLFRDPDSGQLVNEKGFPIQGEAGPITIDPTVADRDITVATDGTINAGGAELGRIRTATFQDNQTLERIDAGTFAAGADSVAGDQTVRIQQYRHELSNVQPVAELVALIVNTRQYEAVQKATRTLSDSLREYIRE